MLPYLIAAAFVAILILALWLCWREWTRRKAAEAKSKETLRLLKNARVALDRAAHKAAMLAERLADTERKLEHDRAAAKLEEAPDEEVLARGDAVAARLIAGDGGS